MEVLVIGVQNDESCMVADGSSIQVLNSITTEDVMVSGAFRPRQQGLGITEGHVMKITVSVAQTSEFKP